jgi:hypothetical protein
LTRRAALGSSRPPARRRSSLRCARRARSWAVRRTPLPLRTSCPEHEGSLITNRFHRSMGPVVSAVPYTSNVGCGMLPSSASANVSPGRNPRRPTSVRTISRSVRMESVSVPRVARHSTYWSGTRPASRLGPCPFARISIAPSPACGWTGRKPLGGLVNQVVEPEELMPAARSSPIGSRPPRRSRSGM